MNKADLVALIADEKDLSKRLTEEIIDALFAKITEAILADEDVKVTGFGTFELRERKSRRGVSAHTGKEIIIPAGKTLVFKPSRILKDKINE